MFATQDLEEDGDRGRIKGGVVDEEVRAVEVEGHVEGQVDTAGLRSAGLAMKKVCECLVWDISRKGN